MNKKQPYNKEISKKVLQASGNAVECTSIGGDED